MSESEEVLRLTVGDFGKADPALVCLIDKHSRAAQVRVRRVVIPVQIPAFTKRGIVPASKCWMACSPPLSLEALSSSSESVGASTDAATSAGIPNHMPRV